MNVTSGPELTSPARLWTTCWLGFCGMPNPIAFHSAESRLSSGMQYACGGAAVAGVASHTRAAAESAPVITIRSAGVSLRTDWVKRFAMGLASQFAPKTKESTVRTANALAHKRARLRCVRGGLAVSGRTYPDRRGSWR